MVSLSKPSVKQLFSSSVGSLSNSSRTSRALPAVVSAGRPSRFAGGQRTRPVLRPVAAHACRGRRHPVCRWRHRGERSYHCYAGLPWSARPAALFIQVPDSQRLKPQSSMPEPFCTCPFTPATQRICRSLSRQGRRTSSPASSSKQEHVGSHQPPNPSFKRTRLRRSA